MLITFTKQLPSYKTGGTTIEQLLCCLITTPETEEQRKLKKILDKINSFIILMTSPKCNAERRVPRVKPVECSRVCVAICSILLAFFSNLHTTLQHSYYSAKKSSCSEYKRKRLSVLQTFSHIF